MARQADAHLPIRLIILKSRQKGVTTLVQALFFLSCIEHGGLSGLTVAHRADDTEEIFNKSSRFLSGWPGGSMLGHRGAQNSIAFKNGSRLRAFTAGGRHVASGSTNHLLHYSEVAKSESQMDKSGETYASIANTVHRVPNTMVILEGTAQGRGGLFYDLWNKAVSGYNWEKPGEGDFGFMPIFIPWQMDPDARRPVGPDFTRTEQEAELAATFGLDDQQLQWRRWTLNEQCYGDLDLFNQEHPITPHVAWLSSGRTFFSRGPLLSQMANAEKLSPTFRGFMNLPLAVAARPRYNVTEHSAGHLTVWEDPQPQGRYLLGVDPAGGGDGDYSAIEVFAREGMSQVAEFHARVDGGVLARAAYALGMHYNEGWVAVERNYDPGCVREMRNLGYRKLYHGDRLDHPYFHSVPVETIGWFTSPQSKRYILQGLETHLRAGEIRLRSPKLIDELLSIIVDDKGSAAAPHRAHDDLAMSAALAVELRRRFPDPMPPLELTVPQRRVKAVKDKQQRFKQYQKQRRREWRRQQQGGMV